MNRTTIIKIAISAIVLLALTSEKIDAIPAFARKYQISCQVCHTPAMPRLKAFGDDFAGNGFRMTEYEAPRHFIETGDEKLSLFRELPLAFRFDGYATLNFNDAGAVDFGAPFVLKILSGGELSDKLSYYMYFLFSEYGEIAGLEDAFLFYRDLFGSDLNITLGQFAVSDPLFKGELRYTIENYKIYSVAPGESSINLKYDKGIVLDRGFSTGTTIVAEVVNGNGIGEAGEGYLFDKDKYKNVMLRVAQDIGGFASIGFFGYSGKELLNDDVGSFTSSVKMYGPDLVLDFNERLSIGIQYVWRTDSDVYLDPEEPMLQDVHTQGGFAEVIYSPKGDMSKWYLTGLVNYVESEVDALDYTAATLHAGYLLRRNVRLVTEFTQTFKGNKYGKLSAGFVSAF
ncbi:MAG: hypothetical protein MUC78_08435 [Bacteroidales bacterium]|jgi:hypothetical protein|nr:hypothetical protein [Bacteroidales bacterium]